MKERVYLTTTLPYVNADPHIGFALEIVQADIIARYHRLLGDEVFFNFGTDEYGVKIYRKAQETGKNPQTYVNEHSKKFANLKQALNLSYDAFVRTTNPHHQVAVQEFWRCCLAKGDIYKKNYAIKYCVGCELEKTDSELANGKCLIHPNLAIELIAEENYFFRFSKYGELLLKLYARQSNLVVPDFRFNEIKKFVEGGLDDFSISRLKEKMPWGVAVPGDDTQVMYVWFDALIAYISTLGWPKNEKNFTDYWGSKTKPNAIQFAGKDQIRQQAAMWQAMLMSADLPTSKQIVIHGFINVGGQKMSKSLGNVIDPYVIVEEYGTDALRYYLARHVHPFEDSDFTMEKFKEAYNADLANGLGNVVARVMQMASQYLSVPVGTSKQRPLLAFGEYLNKYEIHAAIAAVWADISIIDELIQKERPFEIIKTDKTQAQQRVIYYVEELSRISRKLSIFIPETAERIQQAIKENKKPENLFPRKD